MSESYELTQIEGFWHLRLLGRSFTLGSNDQETLWTNELCEVSSEIVDLTSPDRPRVVMHFALSQFL